MGTYTLESPNTIGRIGNFYAVGNGIVLSVDSGGDSAQFPTLSSVPGFPTTGSPATDVLIVNAGATDVFIAFGTSVPTVTIPVVNTPANGICIKAGNTLILSKGDNTYVGAITASSSSTVYFYQGYGI